MNEEFNVKETVSEMLDDLSYVCDTKKDYYKDWTDTGAASMEAFLEELDSYQLTDVVDYLTYYISDIYENEKGAHNKAIGLKAALEYALREMYEYASLGASEITQEDYDEYGDEITAADIENSDRIRCLRLNLESVEKIKFIDE